MKPCTSINVKYFFYHYILQLIVRKYRGLPIQDETRKSQSKRFNGKILKVFDLYNR